MSTISDVDNYEVNIIIKNESSFFTPKSAISNFSYLYPDSKFKKS